MFNGLWRRLLSSQPGASEGVGQFLDFTKPSGWYPLARKMKRRIICHVGPTNSGKTHAAVQQLAALGEGSGKGLYCAPLRLLAIEMYEKLNRQHRVPCSLRTGEITCVPSESVSEAVALPPGSRAWRDSPLISCTVEMADISAEYSVAVVDEVQMMGDDQRGWAFTQAVLGLPARTLYLCGEEASLGLIQRLCAETGDTMEVRRFERLSPLRVEERHLQSDLTRVQAGDCVVAFSRRSIFDLKAQIERRSNQKCAVVYGNLPMGIPAAVHPPDAVVESRSQQAKLFNEQLGYNVLVASDAIGMGLNL